MTTTRPTKTAADEQPRSMEATKTAHTSVPGPGGTIEAYLLHRGHRYPVDHPVVARHPGFFKSSWELPTAGIEPLRRRDPEAKTAQKNRAVVRFVAVCDTCSWSSATTDERDQATLARQQHRCPPERRSAD